MAKEVKMKPARTGASRIIKWKASKPLKGSGKAAPSNAK
jgi:hypothetical protein